MTIDIREYLRKLQGCDLYFCEFLFDDWNNFDKILKDKDLYVVSYVTTYPKGPEDRRHLHCNLPLSDDKCIHHPTFRVFALTSSKILAKNIQRSIGVSYDSGRYPVLYTYNLLKEAKQNKITRVEYLAILKEQLLNRFVNLDKSMYHKIQTDEVYFWVSAAIYFKDLDEEESKSE